MQGHAPCSHTRPTCRNRRGNLGVGPARPHGAAADSETALRPSTLRQAALLDHRREELQHAATAPAKAPAEQSHPLQSSWRCHEAWQRKLSGESMYLNAKQTCAANFSSNGQSSRRLRRV